MKDLPQRKNIRLRGFDYSQNGAYFITICVKDRHELLGKIVEAAIGRPPTVSTVVNQLKVEAAIGRPPHIILSEYGIIVDEAIQKIHEIYENVEADKYVIMPNHIHMILLINDGRAMRAPTISTVINQFKGYVTKQIGFSMWQKSFHDHVIRNEEDYQNHWRYIDENPARWVEDEYY